MSGRGIQEMNGVLYEPSHQPGNKHETEEIPCSLKGIKPSPGSRIGRRLQAVYHSKYDDWLRSFGLKPCWEVHKDCLEFHIWHGYRPNPSSFLYCIKSAFHPSNETLNAWTHFIPLLIMFWRTYEIYQSLDEPTSDITLPLWVQSFGICAIFLASTIAHLFNCYSATGQELCFCLDYGVIPVYGLTTAISFEHLVSPYRCFGLPIADIPLLSYTEMIFVVSLTGAYLTCQSRYPKCAMRYLCRFGPYGVCFVIGGFPSFVRFLVTLFPTLPQLAQVQFSESELCYLGENYAFLYSFHTIAMAAGVTFVGSRFPEKWFPGTFDIVGHSHQSFHICIAIGLFLQHIMTENALKSAIKLRDAGIIDEEALQVKPSSIVVLVALFVLAVSFIIYRTSTKVGRLIEIQRLKKNE